MGRVFEGYIPSETDLFSTRDFKQLTEDRMRDKPEVPMFSYTDYASGEKTCITPATFKKHRDAVATVLHEAGFKRDHIVILAPNSYFWLLVLHAIVASDNVAVVLDSTLEESSMLTLAHDSEAKAIFAGPKQMAGANKYAEESGATVYAMDDIEAIMADGEQLIADGKTEVLSLETDPKAAALISYSSGTTGRAKGVMLSQQNLMSNALMFLQNASFDGDEVSMVPFNHILGVGVAQFCTLMSGYTFHVNQNIRYLYRDLAENAPGTCILVPMLVQNMIDLLWKKIRKDGREAEVRAIMEQNKKNNVPFEERRRIFADDLAMYGGKLSKLVCGGAPLPVELYEACDDFGIHLLEGYGITECSPVLSVNMDTLCKVGTVGRIIPGEEVKIDRPDADGIGEICVKGPHVMLGYYKMPEATAEAMEGGWFHTGDLGFLDEDLYLTITGRIKNLIILSNGENVSPEELEQIIGRCPLVQEVIVYEKGDYIGAMIYPNMDEVKKIGIAEAQRVTRAFIKTFNKQMTIYKRIHNIVFRNTPFQRTALKKIKRTAIEEE